MKPSTAPLLVNYQFKMSRFAGRPLDRVYFMFLVVRVASPIHADNRRTLYAFSMIHSVTDGSLRRS